MRFRGGRHQRLLCLPQGRRTKCGAGWGGRGHGRFRHACHSYYDSLGWLDCAKDEGKGQGKLPEPCCGLHVVEEDPETHELET